MPGSPGWLAHAGWLAAFLGPPAVALAVWHEPAAHHVTLAVVLGVTYEVLIAAARFAGGVIGDLASRWRKRLVDRLDLALQNWFSRFDRDYRSFVLAGLRFIDQKGLATVGPFTPELDDVFIDVSLAPQPPHLVKDGLLPDLPTDVTERRALSEFLDDPEPVVLAIIGAPGSGKTTLLRHTARRVCQGRRRQRRRLPILLYLRDHAAAIVADPNVALTDLLRTTLGERRTAEPSGWFELRLRDGNCVVLLDGLDEVAHPEDRRKVAVWAERQIRLYPRNDYVITSRPYGYRAAGIGGADVLQVRGFTSDQVSRFVHGWYLAVERHSTADSSEEITVRARREADDLLQRLNRAAALYELTVNPLLLTMIANVHRYRGALPGSRADLYAEIIQVMLFRRQEAKNLPEQLDGDKKEALLRGLAYAMMQRRLSDLPRDEILAEIKPALRRLPRQVTAAGFLADVGSNGLLVERESGLYCFAHHTFQEYLAAAYIRDKGLVDVLAKAVDDPWWRETTLLYAARADADPIVAACLDSGTITALALAFDIAYQGSEFDEELRDRLEGLLAEVSNPTTSQERRRLITGVLLTRHLHAQIRSSNGTRICIHPVTRSLYRLFQDDTHTPAPESPPLYTTEADPVVSGIRASDAVAFARWVNSVIGGEATYHLPSHAALDDSAVQRLITSGAANRARSFWIESGQAAVELWVPSGARNPHQIDAGTLTKHLDSDMTKSGLTLTRLLLMRSAVAIGLFASYLAWDPGTDRDSVFAHDIFGAINRARIVARDVLRALDRPIIVDRTLPLALDLNHALALERSRSRDGGRDLPHDFTLDRTSDLALARDLALAVDRSYDFNVTLNREGNDVEVAKVDLNRGLALDRDLALDNDLARTLERELTLDPDLALDRDMARALERERAHGSDLAQSSDHAVLLSRVLGIRCSRIMGSVLSQSLSDALRQPGQASDWPVQFSKSFGDVAGISGSSYLIFPDELAQRLTEEVQALQAASASRSNANKSSWAATIGRRLQQNAIPIFNRQEELTSGAATSIRLASLCLAGEALTLNQRQLNEDFREIAAGITRLERRVKGDDPATEMIVLASE